MASCSPWQDRYFDNGIGELRQQDVKDKLGKPHLVDDPHLSDETTWKYRYVLSESDLDPVGLKPLGKEAGSLLGGPDAALREKVYCFVYVLTFDKEAVLRTWNREICQVPNPPNLFEQSHSGN
jgi:hypothetical protein